LKQLQGERELKLQRGNRPSEVTIDLCFVIDCTGSMSPWIAAAKEQIRGVVGDIVPRINKEHPGMNISLRLAMVAYRDHGDPVQYDCLDFVVDTESLYAHLAKQKAEGGGDGPEAVLGALHRAADLDGWDSKLRFVVLIADAPSHGRDCTDDPTDRYPDGDPEDPINLRVDVVMGKLKDRNIELMFCRIRKKYTLKMERAFRKFYNDESRNKKLTTVDMFDANMVPVNTNGFHIVFCLDQSGSMRGQKWKELKLAYHQFLQRRVADQGMADIVSVIQFSDRPHVTEDCVTISQALNRSSSLRFGGGGTRFREAFECAEAQFGLQPNQTPLLVFMSDGRDGCSKPMPAVQSLQRNFGPLGLQAHAIGFGSGANVDMLTQMATAAGGSYHHAVDGVDLCRQFVEIARGCTAVDGLLSRFAEIVSGMVANKVMLDHL